MKKIYILLIMLVLTGTVVEAQKKQAKNKEGKKVTVKKKQKTVKKKITTFILTRHAEKENDGTDDPNLSAEGTKRAYRLSKVLSITDIDRILSTPYKRTEQTMKHIAREAGLEIETYDFQQKNLLKTLLKRNRGKTIVISGHSNTTPALVNQLIGQEKYQQLEENDYDKLFIVSCTSVGNGSEVVIEY